MNVVRGISLKCIKWLEVSMSWKELFDDFETLDQMFPRTLYEDFSTRIVYISTKSPRDPYFSGTLEIGKEFLTAVLDGTPLPYGGDVYLVFPERWMNVKETRNFRHLLREHPNYSEVKSLSIVSCSIELIASYSAEAQVKTVEEINGTSEILNQRKLETTSFIVCSGWQGGRSYGVCQVF